MGWREKLIEKEIIVSLLVIPVFMAVLLVIFPSPTSYWTEFFWVFPVAISFALIANILSVSGAVLFVPFFLLILPVFGVTMPVQNAIKAGLITEFFGVTSSSLAFMRFGLDDSRLVRHTLKRIIPLVVLGSLISFILPKAFLYFFLAGATLLSSYLMLHEERKQAKIHSIENTEIGDHAGEHPENVTREDIEGQIYRYRRDGYSKRFKFFGLGALSQGISGAGIGEIGMVAMIETGIPLHIAIGSVHEIVAITSLIAAVMHLAQATVVQAATPWNLIMVTVPGVIIGGQLAPYIAARIKTHFFEETAALVFFMAAFSLVFVGLSLL